MTMRLYKKPAVITEEIPTIESEIINDNNLSFSNVSIFGTVMSQNVRLLVDTGAAITVISEQFF